MLFDKTIQKERIKDKTKPKQNTYKHHLKSDRRRDQTLLSSVKSYQWLKDLYSTLHPARHLASLD